MGTKFVQKLDLKRYRIENISLEFGEGRIDPSLFLLGISTRAHKVFSEIILHCCCLYINNNNGYIHVVITVVST